MYIFCLRLFGCTRPLTVAHYLWLPIMYESTLLGQLYGCEFCHGSTPSDDWSAIRHYSLVNKSVGEHDLKLSISTLPFLLRISHAATRWLIRNRFWRDSCLFFLRSLTQTLILIIFHFYWSIATELSKILRRHSMEAELSRYWTFDSPNSWSNNNAKRH